MSKRLILSSLIGLVMLALAGCSTLSEAADNKTVDFSKEQDLSIYYVQEEEAPKKEPVPLDPELTYVDTDYLTHLLAGVPTTSTSRKTYEEYPKEWNFVLIDARPGKVFAEGHINGAINIPDSQFAEKAALLPEDKQTELIFYCGGLACPLSKNSAKKAIELGYENVKVYQEGTPLWKKSDNYLVVTDEYVKGLILETNVVRDDKKPFVIIDARPYSSYFDAHIPNAVFFDGGQYKQKYAGIASADKATEIIVYCGGFMCGKSHAVANKLVADGYSNVKVFAGGMPVWKASKLPTFGMSGNGQNFNVAEGKVDRGLTPVQFTEKLESGKVFVLDVRTEEERSHGGIEGSINIPDSKILANPAAIAGKLPEDKATTILIHCASGVRASGVVDKIADLGYENAYYLNNAIQISADGSYSFN